MLDKEKVSNLKSMTLPDESYTIRELFERYRKGQSLSVSQEQPNFDYATENFDAPDLSKVKHEDLHDQELFVKKQRETSKKIEDKFKLSQKQQQDLEAQEKKELEEIKEFNRKRKLGESTEGGNTSDLSPSPKNK